MGYSSFSSSAESIEELFNALVGQRGKADKLERMLEARGLDVYAHGFEEGMEAVDLIVIDHDGGKLVAEYQGAINHDPTRR